MVKIIEQTVYAYLDDDAIGINERDTDRKAFVESDEESIYLTLTNADGIKRYLFNKEFAENIAKAILEKLQ